MVTIHPPPHLFLAPSHTYCNRYSWLNEIGNSFIRNVWLVFFFRNKTVLFLVFSFSSVRHDPVWKGERKTRESWKTDMNCSKFLDLGRKWEEWKYNECKAHQYIGDALVYVIEVLSRGLAMVKIMVTITNLTG